MTETIQGTALTWNMFAGMHLLLAGSHGPLRQNTEALLTARCSDPQTALTWAAASDLTAVTEADTVLLFAAPETMDELMHLLDQLQQLDRRPVGGVLLLSDISVYGKYFGPQEPRREDQMGYACHTSAEDRPAALLRMAEHAAWRLADEHQLKLVIVRGDRHAEGEDLDYMIRCALLALQKGTAGEAYNLPCSGSDSGRIEDLPMQNRRPADTSPLSPNPIWTSTDKIKQIIQSGEKHVTA